jgi:hypothetical protein
MARCGCTGTTCSCKIVGKGSVIVTGAGTITNPYEVTVTPALIVNDTTTVDLTLYGSGSSTDPYVLSADADLALGDLNNVDTTGGAVGYVPALQADGSFILSPPSTAPVGAVTTGLALDGDGSGGDPLNVRLDALAGLEIAAGGLRLDPYTVASEGVLDATYGALPSGSFVADTDGLNAWVKSDTGWSPILEDTGLIATTAGNITAEAGWTISSLQMRRKNGLVQLRVSATTTVSRITAIGSGNIGNIKVAQITPSEFRPSIEAPLRVLGAGDDAGFYVTVAGGIYLNNLSQPDYETPAGYVWSIAGTWIGQ